MTADENLLDEIGMIQKETFLRSDSEMRNIAVVLCQILEERQRAAAIGKEVGKRQ
jgi:hypothetical protein